MSCPRLYLAPGGSDGARSASHHCAGGGGPDRGDAGRGEREPSSRLRDQYQGLPATLAGEAGRHEARQRPDFLFEKTGGRCLRELAAGNNAVVSEPFANKHHVKAGDIITLPLGEQGSTFRVIDIFYDYGHEAGYIVLDCGHARRYLPDSAPTNLAVYLAPGADLGRTRAAIQKAMANKSLMMLSNGEIRRRPYGLRPDICDYLCGGGHLDPGGDRRNCGALMSIVIDRRREFGVLRYSGGARASQIRKLILVEAGLIGLLANVAGLALGLCAFASLIYVINKQSFGWTIQFHWPVAVLLGSLTPGVRWRRCSPGLYPARVAIRLKPIEVVHEE